MKGAVLAGFMACLPVVDNVEMSFTSYDPETGESEVVYSQWFETIEGCNFALGGWTMQLMTTVNGATVETNLTLTEDGTYLILSDDETLLVGQCKIMRDEA